MENDKSEVEMVWYLLKSNTNLSWIDIIGTWLFKPDQLKHYYNQELYFSDNMKSRWSNT